MGAGLVYYSENAGVAVLWPLATIDNTRLAQVDFAKIKLVRLGPRQEHAGPRLSLNAEMVQMLFGLD